eukprot:tig00020996_g16940.t1
MSIYAVCELLVHFDSFRNIDLFQQGWYHIRTRIYSEKTMSPGVPITHFKTSSHASGPGLFVVPAHMDTEKMTFACRTFSVMYCDDRGDLGDVGYFRIELETNKDMTVEPVMIEFELMFCSASRKTPPSSGADFERVAVQRIRIQNLTKGIHSYFGAMFDEWHLVLANIMVHSVLLDFRFRSTPPVAYDPTKVEKTGSKPAAPGAKPGIPTSRAPAEKRKSKVQPSCSPFCAYYTSKGGLPSSLASLLFPSSLYSDSGSKWPAIAWRKRDPIPNFMVEAGSEQDEPMRQQEADASLADSLKPVMNGAHQSPRTMESIMRAPSTTGNGPAAAAKGATPVPGPLPTEPQRPASPSSPRPNDATCLRPVNPLLKHAESVHRQYTGPLNEAYRRLSRKLGAMFADAPLTVGQRRMLEDTLRLPPLRLPWDAPASSGDVIKRTGSLGKANGAAAAAALNESANRFDTIFRDIANPKPEKLADVLVSDMHQIAEQIFDLWRRLMTLCVHCPRELCSVLRNRFERKLQVRWAHSTYRDILDASYLHGLPEDVPELNTDRADKLRKEDAYIKLEMPVEDLLVPVNALMQPVLFQQLYQFGGKDGAEKEKPDAEVAAATAAALAAAAGEGARSVFSGVGATKTLGELNEHVTPRSNRTADGLVSLLSDGKHREAGGSGEGAGSSGSGAGSSSSGGAAAVGTPLALGDINLGLGGKQPGDGHLIVFVHGFQGNAFDLRLFRDYLQLFDTRAEFLMSSANESEKTTGCLRQMGLALAREVHDFVQRNAPQFRLSRLSFVGHSIGGVIIRSALTQAPMKPYLPFLYTYVSLSAPHLGYMYASNRLMQSAMWFLRTVKKCKSVQQLAVQDATTVRGSFLFELSQSDALRHFKNVVLVSSPQDRYSPWHSSRVENSPEAMEDAASSDPTRQERGKAYADMVKGLMWCLKPEQLIRLDVVFGNQKRNLDSAIGRTAHIQLLECRQFIHMFCTMFRPYFE